MTHYPHTQSQQNPAEHSRLGCRLRLLSHYLSVLNSLFLIRAYLILCPIQPSLRHSAPLVKARAPPSVAAGGHRGSEGNDIKWELHGSAAAQAPASLAPTGLLLPRVASSRPSSPNLAHGVILGDLSGSEDKNPASPQRGLRCSLVVSRSTTDILKCGAIARARSDTVVGFPGDKWILPQHRGFHTAPSGEGRNHRQ